MSRQDLSVVEAGEVSQLPITIGHVHEIHAHFGARIAEQQGGEKSASLTNKFVQRAVQNMDKGTEYCFLTKAHADNGPVALVILKRDGDVFSPTVWFAEGKCIKEYVMGTFAAIKTYILRCHKPRQIIFSINEHETPYSWVSLALLEPKISIIVHKRKGHTLVKCAQI